MHFDEDAFTSYLLIRNGFSYFAMKNRYPITPMRKNCLEEQYDRIMRDTTPYHEIPSQERDEDRFKSILHPDYSEYSTSTITGNIC